jgi:hypothetical protein
VWPVNVLWQGALLAPVIMVLSVAGLWLAYRRTWRGPQRWMEANRHRHRLALIVGRLIWFRWIHPDCQYWILHVDFSNGPLELRGHPTPSLYWSVTYTTWTEVNPVLNSRTTKLEDDGGYRIRMSVEPPATEHNWIPVRADAGKGVIYVRIYEADAVHPVMLPQVRQNGRIISHGGTS